MRKLLIICLFPLLLLAVTSVSSQTIRTVGSGGNYATLATAFTAINNGTLQGNIVLQLISSSSSNPTLNATGGSANYTSVLIYPTDAGVILTGTIYLNGASNVIIDGRINAIGTSKNLIIQNETSYAMSALNVVNCDFKYCVFKSSYSTGSIVLLRGSSLGPGCNNNIIEYCDFTHYNGTRPNQAIYSYGDASYYNIGNTIKNCNFIDLITAGLSPGYVSCVIFLQSNNDQWTLTGNSIYGNILPGSGEIRVVSIQGNPNTSFTLKNNYIGGTEPLCGGDKMTLTSGSGRFRFFYLSGGSTSDVGIDVDIDSNTIKNIDIYRNTDDYDLFECYRVRNIKFNNNNIGSNIGTESVILRSASTVTINCLSMPWQNTDGTSEYNNNTIGSIKIIPEGASNSLYFIGIDGVIKNSASGNMFGSLSTQNSIEIAANTGSSSFRGIVNGSGATNMASEIKNNTFANITNNSTGSSTNYAIGVFGGKPTIFNNTIKDITVNSSNTNATNMSLSGIHYYYTTHAAQEISKNIISNLKNLNSTAAVYVSGINYTGNVDQKCLINNNTINRISAASGTADVSGIRINSPIVDCVNNMIALGDDISSGAKIFGIYDGHSSGLVNFYFNSIRILGTASGTTNSTFAMYSLFSSDKVIKNNIFVNERSGGATGKHYTIRLGWNNNIAIDYNNYYSASGSLGSYNNTDKTNITDWRASTLQDVNSNSASVDFVSDYDLHISDAAIQDFNLVGTPIAQYPFDFDGDPRYTPYMGVDEVYYLWTGNVSSDWNSAGNWNPSTVPNASIGARIPNVVTKPIVFAGINALAASLSVATESGLTIDPEGTLSVSGDLSNNGIINVKSSASGDGSLIVNGNISGSGTYNIERYLAANKWHLVSSPITNAMSGIFTGIWLRPYDETTNAFGAYITPTNVPLTAGQGYSNWTYNNETRTFSGTINNGTVGPIDLPRTNLGWNLIGNPYPSAIDWDAATGWTKTNVANSVYVWNGSIGQYATYIGGVANNGGSQYIPMGQGFFVQAQAGGGSIAMNNNVRVHNSVAFMKNDDPANIIRIKVATAESSDESVIAIRSGVMDEFDYQFDATKLRGDASAPQLYTQKADTETAICAYSELDKVYGKFVSLEPAQYTEHVLLYTHTLDGNQIPQLYDHVTQTLIYPNVPFTFTPTENDPVHRFEFKEPATTFIRESANGSIMVWESNGTLYIDNLEDEILKEVRVFDMQGKLVYVGNQQRNDVNNLSNGVYVVSLRMDNNETVYKKISCFK